MNSTLAFIRIFALFISLLLGTALAVSTFSFGPVVNAILGLVLGAVCWGGLLVCESVFKKFNLRTFNLVTLGLFCGFLMSQAIIFALDGLLALSPVPVAAAATGILHLVTYLVSLYLAMVMTARTAEELYITIPFVKFKAASQKKKDIVLDPAILTDSRIIDLAASGLVDHQLIIPRFALKELYVQLEAADENVKSRARRTLDVVKRLESIPTLDMRYSDTDFPEIKDQTAKLIRLSRMLDANIITSDINRIQQSSIESAEGIRIINLHTLANALKPLSQAGEHITIKVQRYGKEPRQGVGYLDDGTMVVVNGGAEYIGENIKAQVLSVKHTSSGRMIFCNAADAPPMTEREFAQTVANMESAHKNYFAL